jgi:hypothetical protein
MLSALLNIVPKLDDKVANVIPPLDPSCGSWIWTQTLPSMEPFKSYGWLSFHKLSNKNVEVIDEQRDEI